MSARGAPSAHRWIAIALVAALIAGHGVILRYVMVRRALSAAAVVLLIVVVIVKLGVLGMLRARGRRRPT